MGLAGQKNKKRFSQDPNNTNWAKSTDTFGHKILTQQGWKPGEYLGARDASHKDHYTAANASHVRVLLREDNLGLGAKLGGNNAETFGLSLFSGLLGRLNGKSDDEVQKQANAQRDVELSVYTSRKYGFMNFVRGGLLVGDKMEDEHKDLKGGRAMAETTKPSSIDEPTSQAKASKKRKTEDVEQELDQAQATKKERRSKKSRKDGNPAGAVVADVEADKSLTRKKRKHNRESVKRASDSSIDEISESGSGSEQESVQKKKRKDKHGKMDVDSDPSTAEKESKEAKRKRKDEKQARKEERRQRKETKKLEKQKVTSDSPKNANTIVTSSASTAAPSATSSGTSTPLAFAGGRHAVRQRYIQQKRMASMNAQHLNEIFMLKSAAG